MTSYCSSCGGKLSDDANFCSACGKATVNPGHHPAASMPALVRPRAGRMIAGLCQGLANRQGWDVSYTRIFAVLLGILTFPIGLIVYALGWVIVPEESFLLPTVTSLPSV